MQNVAQEEQINSNMVEISQYCTYSHSWKVEGDFTPPNKRSDNSLEEVRRFVNNLQGLLPISSILEL